MKQKIKNYEARTEETSKTIMNIRWMRTLRKHWNCSKQYFSGRGYLNSSFFEKTIEHLKIPGCVTQTILKYAWQCLHWKIGQHYNLHHTKTHWVKTTNISKRWCCYVHLTYRLHYTTLKTRYCHKRIQRKSTLPYYYDYAVRQKRNDKLSKYKDLETEMTWKYHWNTAIILVIKC